MKNDDMFNYPIYVLLFPLFDPAPSSETVSRDPSAWLEDFLKAWSFPANSKSVLSLQVLNVFRKVLLKNRFYKLPVGQAPSLDETWSFRKLWGYQLCALSSRDLLMLIEHLDCRHSYPRITVCAKREREYSYKTYIQTMVDCTKKSTVKNLPTIQIFDCTILQYFDGVKCHCTNLWLYKTSTLKICCTNFCCTNLLLSKTKSLQICCTNFCCINLRLSKTKTLQICCANFCCILVHLQLYKTSNVQALTLKGFDCPKLRLYKVMNEQNLQLLHNLDSNNTNAICAWSLY